MSQQKLVFFNEDYLSRSWAMLTAAPGWIKPVLMLTLVMFVPIVGPMFVLGYALEWARLTAWGVASVPKMTGVRIGDCIVAGFRAFVVTLCWLIPWGVVTSLVRSLFIWLPINGIGLLISLASVVVGVVVIVACLRATIYQDFIAGLGFSRVFEMVERDFNGILRVSGISLFGGLIAAVVCGIIMTVGSISVIPALIGVAEELSGNASDAYAFSRILGAALSSLGPAIAIVSLVGSFIGAIFQLVVTNAVGLWMLQYDVASWGDKSAPLPQSIPSVPRDWHAPEQPVVPASPTMPTSTIQPVQAPQYQPAEQPPAAAPAPEPPAAQPETPEEPPAQ